MPTTTPPPPPAPPRILLTGATGYIGGTILTHLLASPSTGPITCLIRGPPSRAATLTSVYGPRINPVLCPSLDDAATLTATAAAHDLVINTTLGFHAASALALLRGLALRRADTGRDAWMIHTSGTSNLADAPISGPRVGREFDDARDDVYGYECGREARRAYAQRGTEVAVVDAGVELGVKTVVVMSPTIFGRGTGLFNTRSIQVPTYVRAALGHGRAVVVGKGEGVWDHVHVEDLAELYKILVVTVLERGGEGLPTGREGIVFSGNGRHSWMEVAQGVADACYEEGGITERGVESVGLAEGANILVMMGQVDEELVELGLSSNSRTVSSVGRRLGWKPTRGEEAWRKGFRDDIKAALENK